MRYPSAYARDEESIFATMFEPLTGANAYRSPAGGACGSLRLLMQKRFRKTKASKAAEVWVDVGRLRYSVELYEDGEFVERKRGFRPGAEHAEAFLSGKDFSALVRIQPDGKVRCTWSR